MTDAYLLEESVRRITVLGVIEALSITARHGMHQLGRQYQEELVRRLSVDNFIQVSCALLGVGGDKWSEGAPHIGFTVFEF
jgi:hypothetical protein